MRATWREKKTGFFCWNNFPDTEYSKILLYVLCYIFLDKVELLESTSICQVGSNSYKSGRVSWQNYFPCTRGSVLCMLSFMEFYIFPSKWNFVLHKYPLVSLVSLALYVTRFTYFVGTTRSLDLTLSLQCFSWLSGEKAFTSAHLVEVLLNLFYYVPLWISCMDTFHWLNSSINQGYWLSTSVFKAAGQVGSKNKGFEHTILSCSLWEILMENRFHSIFASFHTSPKMRPDLFEVMQRLRVKNWHLMSQRGKLSNHRGLSGHSQCST